MYGHYDNSQQLMVVLNENANFPKGSFVRFLNDFIEEQVDTKPFENKRKNGEGGAPAKHVKLMLKVIFYAFSQGIYSMRELASKTIEGEIKRTLRTDNVRVEVPGDRKAVVYVNEKNIPKIIGRKGERISNIEKKLGLNIDVKELIGNKREIKFDMEIDKRDIILNFDKNLIGRKVHLEAEGEIVFSSKVGKNGVIKIKKNTKYGKLIRRAASIDRGLIVLL